jgi:hypothetical protein
MVTALFKAALRHEAPTLLLSAPRKKATNPVLLVGLGLIFSRDDCLMGSSRQQKPCARTHREWIIN